MTALWVKGDTLEVAKQLPDDCVDLIVTSPPFLALRSYLPADDPAKVHEIGQEATPGEFLDVLLDLVVEWRRILTPHGSLCVELGDTYAGSGGAGGDYNPGGLREGQETWDSPSSRARNVTTAESPNGQGSAVATIAASGSPRSSSESRNGVDAKNRGNTSSGTAAGLDNGWPLSKSLCMIPQLFAIALSYGRNPLTGRTLEPWRVRNVVRWCRPNPPVGALGDKFRPATSEMVVACTGRTRWFDLDAVREASPDLGVSEGGSLEPLNQRPDSWRRGVNPQSGGVANPAGAPPLDYWVIPTHPYKGSHYATFPSALVVRPVEAMCPRKVCQVCGQPSERIVERQRASTGNGAGGKGRNGREVADLDYSGVTVGWSDCGHDSWRPGRVLDPFGGSGTTLEVATGHGRDGIGIDLDQRNADLARERIGPMFFEEITPLELAIHLAPKKRSAA